MEGWGAAPVPNGSAFQKMQPPIPEQSSCRCLSYFRYTSSVKYDSEKHFIDDIYMPVGLSISSCSQTVICVPNCTWRNYKAEVHFKPRNKPQRFTSTTIVYPKHAKTVYTTTLDYNCRKTMRRFLSSVELETSECLGNDCVLDGC